MNSRASIAVVVVLAACTSSSLTDADVEKALREQVPTTKSVKVHKITKMEKRPSAGCNPMFDSSTYAVHVTHVADLDKCPRIRTVWSVCGENATQEENLCFNQAGGKWVYSFGETIIPRGTPGPNLNR